jgi:hypothetical protein
MHVRYDDSDGIYTGYLTTVPDTMAIRGWTVGDALWSFTWNAYGCLGMEYRGLLHIHEQRQITPDRMVWTDDVRPGVLIVDTMTYSFARTWLSNNASPLAIYLGAWKKLKHRQTE